MSGELSALQRAALRALDRLSGRPWVAARDIGAVTGRTVDSTASTLRSLVNRDLVTAGGHDGSGWGYRLTDAGRAEARAVTDGLTGAVHYSPPDGGRTLCGRALRGNLRVTSDPHRITCQSCRHNPCLDGAAGTTDR
jgi:DNA-binding MarR family transcriptional regulator